MSIVGRKKTDVENQRLKSSFILLVPYVLTKDRFCFWKYTKLYSETETGRRFGAKTDYGGARRGEAGASYDGASWGGAGRGEIMT